MRMRQYPDKPQNQYGGDYGCPCYDTYHDGREFCHNEIGPTVTWARVQDGKLVCRGNLHQCKRLHYRQLAGGK